MIFKQVSSTQPVVDYLVSVITNKLAAGQPVLWLVPGGSGLQLAVEVANNLAAAPLANLTATLTDERFGPVGHPDSNWHQLLQAGFSLPGATLVPILAGSDRDTTAQAFADRLTELLTPEHYRLGFFGIGPDGHVSGILPDSPAVSATGLAIGYDGGTYQRVTTTPTALAQLDEAVIYAAGQPKWPILDQLSTQDLPISVQPAQCLKQIKNVTIFNDHLGERA